MQVHASKSIFNLHSNKQEQDWTWRLILNLLTLAEGCYAQFLLEII
jgi:hypothetical protein